MTNTYGSNTNVYFEPMNEPHGGGTNLNLTVRNASGRDRIRYGWGL